MIGFKRLVRLLCTTENVQCGKIYLCHIYHCHIYYYMTWLCFLLVKSRALKVRWLEPTKVNGLKSCTPTQVTCIDTMRIFK